MRQGRLTGRRERKKEGNPRKRNRFFQNFPKEEGWRPVEDVRKCGHGQCALCVSLEESEEVRSRVTEKRFKIGGREGEVATCSTENLVYLATCQNCGLQYVGYTGQRLNHRFGGHRAEGKRAQKEGSEGSKHSTFFSTHFEEECGWESLTVQPVELIQDEGRKTQREMQWASMLGTFYPYGLNDRIELLPKAPTIKGRMEAQLSRARSRMGGGKGGGGKEGMGPGDLQELAERRKMKRKRKREREKKETERGENGFDGMNYIEGAMERRGEGEGWVRDIMKSEETLTKKQREEVMEEMRWMDEEEMTRGEKQVKDLIEDKIRRTQGWKGKEDRKKKTPELIWGIEFKNPTMEKLGLGRILRSERIKRLLPTGLKYEPAVVFTYVQPTRRSILQYKKELIASEGRNLDDIHCECEGNAYTDKDLGHICTGNLSIVVHAVLKQVLEKGPKYRERRIEDWEETEEEIRGTIEGMIEEWAKREGMHKERWRGWREEMEKEIRREKNKKMRGAKMERRDGPFLESKAGEEALGELQRRFVLVSADKSENNVVVVCKRFYVQRIREELAEGTYRKEERKEQEIVEEIMERVERFGKVPKELQKLATLY